MHHAATQATMQNSFCPMACIFLIDGNHFQTCYVTPTPDGQDYAIYIYDGMKNKGYAVYEPKATLATHMIGREVITRPGESSRTHAVLYQLRGGRITQKAFLEAQLGIAERVHGLSFDSHDMNIIPDVTFTRHSYQEFTNDEIWWRSSDSKIQKYTASPIPYKRDLTPVDRPEQSKQSRKQPAITKNLSKSPVAKIQSPSNKSSSGSSEPDMIFQCRCGTSGNSDYFTTPEKGVCCDSCGFWSHLACQRGLNGMARPPFLSSPKEARIKETEFCAFSWSICSNAPTHRKSSSCKRWSVLFWTVKWLRFNHFVKGSPRIPGEVTLVHENDIVDELWQDQKGR
ncbi:hypothetical protein F5146DRAFT_1004052 [Armillaria mellea]|nr:hypothetical protein F5146DRAFT_1004052 [Armillaria mellea]